MRRVATVADDAAVRQGLGNHRVGLFARDGQMARRTVHMTNWAPQDLDGIAPRILSRLSWGLVAAINSADYELRFNIIC